MADRRAGLLRLAALAALAAATAVHGAGARPAAAPTLVVDNSFALDTTDPHRAFDPTASIVDRAVYDTLFTYRGNDLAHPIPLLVRAWTSTRARTFTFRLRRDVHFADGTPLTSADVVFSLRRLVDLKGNPAFLLDGVTVSAKGRYTVVAESSTSAPQLPSILANPSTGIVNSKLVRAHGGTAAGDASTADRAEEWLNSSASRGAGSGPYALEEYSPTSQIALRANPRYWGARKPAFSAVVLRNMAAPTQLLNIRRGSRQIALDLSSDQAETLKGDQGLRVSRQPSPWVFYLFANDDTRVSPVTANRQFQQALRYALDYSTIRSVAGPGAIQAPGIIPSMLLGALPQEDAIRQDLTRAKAALAASGVGAQRVTLEYPSDVTINGVPFTSLAQRCRPTSARPGSTSTSPARR
jgi:peptide/nickel transport system substrate-binding protein